MFPINMRNSSVINFECDYYKKKYRYKSILIEHIRSHTGEKPYKCDNCSYMCTTSGNLKKHARIHTGEKRYHCKICPYSCTRSNDLKVHARVHTEEKPYHCEQCYKSFSSSRYFEKQICAHHDKKKSIVRSQIPPVRDDNKYDVSQNIETRNFERNDLNQKVEAVCVLQGDCEGTLYFEQASPFDAVKVTGEILGLKQGLHCFHVHKFGNNTKGCTSTGSHFNSFRKKYESPTNEVRHLRDLSNIEAGADGMAKVNVTDNRYSCNITGKTLVDHADTDDLGKGGHKLFKTTGNAGRHLHTKLCKVISNTKA